MVFGDLTFSDTAAHRNPDNTIRNSKGKYFASSDVKFDTKYNIGMSAISPAGWPKISNSNK